MKDRTGAPSDRPPRRRFGNVLFVPLATRGNAAALRRVVSFVRRDDAELTVVGVIPEPSAEFSPLATTRSNCSWALSAARV